MAITCRQPKGPVIHHSVQGAQFTSDAFADRVLTAGVTFSMDGRGRFLDNIFIERLWRSLKYEAVYLYEPQGLVKEPVSWRPPSSSTTPATGNARAWRPDGSPTCSTGSVP